MTRSWTYHWQKQYWRSEHNPEGRPLRSAGSSRFEERGVSPGDFVYIVSLSEGLLHLGGRMIVGHLTDRDQAVLELENDNLIDHPEWIIGLPENGTPLDLHRRLDSDLTKQLEFVSPDGSRRRLVFITDDRLDNQATRGLQELTRESAGLLEQIIAATDKRARSSTPVTAATLSGLLQARAQPVSGDRIPALPRNIASSTRSKADAAKRSAVTAHGGKDLAIARMTETVLGTVRASNGQQALRTVKNKELRFRTPQDLKKHIGVLLEAQEGLCAITGIRLQFDGAYDDKELVCSLDRIDSNGHYEAGNLQVVCGFVNRWKNDSNDAEFRRLMALVREKGDSA